MSTQWGRLNAELLKQHKSWVSLARHLNLEKQNVGNWKSRGIPAKYLRGCAEFVSRSHDWLDLGEDTRPTSKLSEKQPNQPLAGVFIDSNAININVNRRAQLTAQEVVANLSELLAGVEPGRIGSVIAALADLARSPNDEVLRDSLARLMAPAAFTQQNQRTG